MMKNESSMNTQAGSSMLSVLWQLLQPQAMVHLGMGRGLGVTNFWLSLPQVPNALIVEADNARCESLAEKLLAYPQVVCQTAVVADGSEADFFYTSHPDENGLYPSENLVSLWPQLRFTSRAKVATVSLDALVRETMAKASYAVIIDMLPTAALWNGAVNTLASTRLLLVRVRLDENTEASLT
ncbi:MAG: hypothetical protein M1572_01550, partial [Gammaproteobacteria bacterium]|nr:hypothetical protein [Gammaproteobacteria bacterium]